MHILNIMFGQGMGGLEQAFVDYARAITQNSHTVTSLTHPRAWAAHMTSCHTLSNMSEWDPIARFRLRRFIKKTKPDVIIAHGNRAIGMSSGAAQGLCPVIGVAHNYKIKRFTKLDAVFAINKDIIRHLVNIGVPNTHIFNIPNMIDVSENVVSTPFQTPPVIGTMGRFVAKKGLEVFIEALGILKSRGISFRAQIGGEGVTSDALHALAKANALEELLDFSGWVTDKKSFFDGIDIFCLPSHHEPFGIVLLEAMNAKKPIISTMSEGPREILTHGKTGLLVECANPEALADGLSAILADEATAHSMGEAAHEAAQHHFSIEVVGEAIIHASERVIHHVYQ